MHVVTIAGIRPDFIRLAALIKRLDDSPNVRHTLIHTGQHYSKNLSDVFFQELNIRDPDVNLGCGGNTHVEQLASLLPRLISNLNYLVDKREPHCVLFLGDSNSVLAAPTVKKEGYTIGHIEALMRSKDMRMLEETNRICCDSVSDKLFVYHRDYLKYGDQLLGTKYVVGNTIVEPTLLHKPTGKKEGKHILVDIHRPENFNDRERLSHIIKIAALSHTHFSLPVYFLAFPRTMGAITKFSLNIEGLVDVIPLVGYKEFLQLQYNAKFIISDSGSAMEETCLLNTPLFVPREYNERPQSYWNFCSTYLNINIVDSPLLTDWIDDMVGVMDSYRDVKWLGDGNTSKMIVDILIGENNGL